VGDEYDEVNGGKIHLWAFHDTGAQLRPGSSHLLGARLPCQSWKIDSMLRLRFS
jgi:hypothetical protein